MKMNKVIIENFIPIWDTLNSTEFEKDVIDSGLYKAGEEEKMMDYFLLETYKFNATDDYHTYISHDEALLYLFMLTFPEAIEEIIPYE